MNPKDAIRIMREYVEADRKMRDNSTESDYDKFCEEKNLAIEEMIRLAEMGQAIEKATNKFGRIELEYFCTNKECNETELVMFYCQDDTEKSIGLLGWAKE